ncbi:hypothetical protein QBC46DRAFT_447025 [Diplogelasinospora grovesii]|uniref:Xylanolytic transcriptional activator regulatory domain-containing protein n=1 Tax=Diplogelasinospora grovesii TaxID=303347 RepID=A0AAN6NEM4_9PEZI|nr:hypothetical protein QBC46DRAFT_447025 [Diplogelasinospora grovesii]
MSSDLKQLRRPMRNMRDAAFQLTTSQPRTPGAAAPTDENREATNSELLEGIRKLESLVVGNANSAALRPAAEAPTAASPLHGSGGGHADTPAPSRASRGSLVKSASGHERYEPLSSKWSSVLASSPMGDGMSVDALTTDSGSEFPFTTGRIQLEDVLSALPAMSHCDQLKDLFHVLHDPTFLADYARFRAQPESMPLSWLALLFAVLSIAVTALDEGNGLLRDLGKSSIASKSIATLTSRYRAAAFRCLEGDHYLWRQNLRTLQALILLIYGINHSHGQSWALLGLIRNVALSLGCHVDPDHFGLGIVEAEQRRRCWAALTMLYMIQNACLGSIDVVADTTLAGCNDLSLMVQNPRVYVGLSPVRLVDEACANVAVAAPNDEYRALGPLQCFSGAEIDPSSAALGLIKSHSRNQHASG